MFYHRQADMLKAGFLGSTPRLTETPGICGIHVWIPGSGTEFTVSWPPPNDRTGSYSTIATAGSTCLEQGGS